MTKMINVTFTTTEFLDFYEIKEKVNKDSREVMLIYEKYNKLLEFHEILVKYFGAEISNDDPVTIKDLEKFITTVAKAELLNILHVKEIKTMDVVSFFKHFSCPDIISDYLSFVCNIDEFDTLLEMVNKYCNEYYGIEQDVKDVTLNEILMFIMEYTDFGSIFIRMERDADIKNK